MLGNEASRPFKDTSKNSVITLPLSDPQTLREKQRLKSNSPNLKVNRWSTYGGRQPGNSIGLLTNPLGKLTFICYRWRIASFSADSNSVFTPFEVGSNDLLEINIGPGTEPRRDNQLNDKFQEDRAGQHPQTPTAFSPLPFRHQSQTSARPNSASH